MTDPPQTVEEVATLAPGQYSWIQTARLTWQPRDTPNGALRVWLHVDRAEDQTNGTHVYMMRYVDGVINRVVYFGEGCPSPDHVRWSERIATATPPQELALPLAGGYLTMPGSKCCYSKAQDGTVLVHFAAKHTSGSFPAGNLTRAVLPNGYRPTEWLGDSKGFGEVAISPSGGVICVTATARSDVTFTISFLSSTGP